MFEKSHQLYEEGCQHLVGGVNSPARYFKAVGMEPLSFESGEGSTIRDADGNEYLDLVGSFGPLILGHNHPSVKEKIHEAVDKGTSFGANNEKEIRLAELVKEAFPSIELLRAVNSGTEAVMSAIRAARGYTGRDMVVKFSGCYHGHYEALLKKAGSGAMTHGHSSSAGVPDDWVKNTLVLPFNDFKALDEVFINYAGKIAGVILEPVTGNMGVALPRERYLRRLRELCDKDGAVLIFDEVMTGFRPEFGGAQTLYNVTPDLTCLGKVIGGGMPVGAYGGKKEIMEQISPLGPVYQAGTLSGNPVTMAAGLETLRILKDENPYPHLIARTLQLEEGFKSAAENQGVALQVNRFGSMISPFFTDNEVVDYDSAQSSDTEKFARVYQELLKEGVFAPPAQFEAWFVPASLTKEQADKVIEAFEKALKKVA